jgi:hypothetical protein
MADQRQSQQERSDAKKAVRQGHMDDAIAAGRLVVRQMTAQERDENDAQRAAGEKARATARKRRSAY